MTPWRPWLPVALASLIVAVFFAAAVHTPRIPVSLAPLPPPVQLVPAKVADLGVENGAPLFTPSRSNLPPLPADSAPTPPPPLDGVIAGAGDAVALVRDTSGATQRVHVGDTVDGWKIVSIGTKNIEVLHGDQRQTVELMFGATKLAPVVAAPTIAVPLPGQLPTLRGIVFSSPL